MPKEVFALVDRSGNDDHDAGHVRALVLETIVWVGSCGRHGEGSSRSCRGRGEEWAAHGRRANATGDLSSCEVMAAKVAVERHDRIGSDFNASRNVIQAAGAPESYARRRGTREVHEHSRRAAIQGAEAGAAITHGARALRAVRACGAIALSTGSAAIDTRFRSILHAVGTGGCGAPHHGIAIGAHAIGIDHADLAVHAIGRARAAAIGIGLGAILEAVHAGRSSAHHRHRIAEAADAIIAHRAGLPIHAIGRAHAAAIGIGFGAILEAVHAGRSSAHHRHRIAEAADAIIAHRAGLPIHAIGHAGTAAIGIGFGAILESVHARWRCAHVRHRIAEAAHAIIAHRAGLPIHAIGHAGTAAIGIGFGAILESVHAAWRCAHVRHWIAEAAQTIAISGTDFPVGTIPARRPAAIDIRLHAVFLRVRTRGHRAHHGRTNLAQTIAAHHAHLAIGTSAARSATIDVRFRAVFRHVAALCGLTNMVLTNVRHAISASVAFDARSRSVTNLAAAFHACKTYSFWRIREHAIRALILRTRLVVGHGVGIVIDCHGVAVSVTHHLLAIICSLSSRGRRIDCDVHLNTRTHHAIDRGTFASRRRAVIRGRTNRTATHSACSAHTAAHAAGTATCSAHSTHAGHAALTHAARSGHSAAAR